MDKVGKHYYTQISILMCIPLVRISKVARSAIKALNEIPIPELPKSLVSSFLPCLKNEGFNERIMGPLVCRGIQLQFKLFSNAHKNE